MIDTINENWKELILIQRKDICISRKLRAIEIQKICKNIEGKIKGFKEKCCRWLGKCAIKDNKRGKYISYFFNNKKVALHRLLFENFVRPLKENENLKFTCKNSNFCLNLDHLQPFIVNKKIKKPKTEKKEHFITQEDLILRFD